MDRRPRAPEKPRASRTFVTAGQDPGNPQAGLHQYQNDFWRFSLAVYGQPGVAGECLGLQDKFGLNINLLLFCAWLGRRGIALTREHLEGASRSIASWHDHVVRPLRRVRRQRKLINGVGWALGPRARGAGFKAVRSIKRLLST